MRDPGLGAAHAVARAVEGRAGLQRGEIRAGVGLREHRGRDDRAGRDLRQVSRLLRVGPGGADQLGRDLRAGAERADPDIAARELLGDHAHRGLAHAEPAKGLGHGQPEHAEAGERLDHRERHQLVAQMPAMGVRRHLLVGEAPELLADHLEGVVGEAPVAEAAALDQRCQPRPARGSAALPDQLANRPGRDEARDRRLVEAELGKPNGLALAHRDATPDALEILAEREAEQHALELAERPGLIEAERPAAHLAQRLDVGREPGEAMDRMLLALEQVTVDRPALRHQRADTVLRLVEQRSRRRHRLGSQLTKVPLGHRFLHRCVPVVSPGITRTRPSPSRGREQLAAPISCPCGAGGPRKPRPACPCRGERPAAAISLLS